MFPQPAALSHLRTNCIAKGQEWAMEGATSSVDSDKRLGKSMVTATETVKAFCVQFSKSKLSMHEAIRAYFTPKTVWENVGLAATTGIEDALGVLAQFDQAMGID